MPDAQSAACWLVVTGNGRYAYTADAASGSISGYGVGRDGSLTLLNSQSGVTGNGSHPIDMALSNNSQYLYVLTTGTQAIGAFQVQADGSLTSVASVSGVSSSAVGFAARQYRKIIVGRSTKPKADIVSGVGLVLLRWFTPAEASLRHVRKRLPMEIGSILNNRCSILLRFQVSQ